MRLMYDSVTAGAIPTNAQLVAGYVSPSSYAWSAASWARFPHSVLVRITPQVSHTGVGIPVLDVERGDASPAQAPGWVHAQRALGQDPTVYCSASVWASVQASFQAASEPQPHYWVAAYPGTGQNLPTLNGVTAVAHQYSGSATSGGNYDLSVVADFWPGVDNAVPPPPPVIYRGDTLLIQGSAARFNTQALADGGLKTNLDAVTAGADSVKWPRLVVSDELWDTLEARTNALDALPAQVSALATQVATLQAAVAQRPDVTLTPDQLSALEQTVSTAVAGLNLAVSPADQVSIAQAVAKELGARLSA